MRGDEARRAGQDFKNEVRRIARQLWPVAEFDGAAMVDGREVDGIFDTEDCRHIVEATISRRKEKAEEDLKKLAQLVKRHGSRTGTRAVRGWFVTADEPTADQRQVANKYRDTINSLSFAQFQSRLVDSRSYLQLRDTYAFGSVRDPSTNASGAEIRYIPLDLVKAGSTELVPPRALLELLTAGCVVVILGDYGAGKSMTLREVYRDLRTRHLSGKSGTFPVFVNLRDHYGQTDPAEIIHRHARNVGFDKPSHLVRAWRAGFVHLLLDGFDEITALSIQGFWRKLQDNRHRAMAGVRRLIDEHPAPATLKRGSDSCAGLLVAGRAHFFDNPSERRTALGLPVDRVELSLNEFTEKQIAEYLATTSLSGFVPEWLPSRPLLVGYLAATRVLEDLQVEGSDGELDPAAGWDILLDRVCDREARIDAGIDGKTVRRILERLATKARDSQGGLGPLRHDSVVEAFRDICGYGPDDHGMVLLQRLPGLGVYHDEMESRIFVDEAFVDSCRGGDVTAFVERPFDFDSSIVSRIESAMGSLGVALANRKLEHGGGLSEGKINTAMELAQRQSCPYLVADLARVVLLAGLDVRRRLAIEGVVLQELELGSPTGDVSGLEFSDCLFGRLELEPQADVAKLPGFRGCYIQNFEGRVSLRDVPAEKFDRDCIIDNFIEAAGTTAAVLTLDLPLGTRVCLTVLKKIYERRGSGRKENALYRGLNQRARKVVPGVLQALKSEGLAVPYRRKTDTIWLPGRDRRRASRLIAAPSEEVNDPVLMRCAGLSG